MNYKKSIFNKILIWFIIIAIIPIFILSTSYYWFFTRVFTDTLIQQTYANTESVTKGVNHLIEEYKEIVNTLSKEEIIDQAMTHHYIDEETKEAIAIKGYLSLAAKLNKASLYIIDSKGNNIFSTHSLPQKHDVTKYKNWGAFRKANNSLSPVLDANHYNHISGDTIAMSVIKAVRDKSSEVKGYIIIDIYRNNIEDICNNVDIGLATDVIITDGNFHTIFNMRSPYLEATTYEASYKENIRRQESGYLKEQINDNQSLITFSGWQNNEIITIAVTPMNIITENQNFIKKIASFAAWISLLICFVCAFFIARNLSKPIRTLVKSMQKVKDGDLNISVEENREDELGILAKNFNTMLRRIKELMENIVEKQERVRLAEIKALQAQINPHFLYNTLDSIKWIAKMNHVEEISTIATHLAKLFRNTIDSGNEIVTVEESIRTIESYLMIQKIRYSDKFDIHINIAGEIMPYKIPKLIFQPIVENATIHGLENKVGRGILSIEGIKQNDHMIFTIKDNGVGMDPDYMEAIRQEEYSGLQKSDSIGMHNVDRRIKLYYGKQYGIKVESSLGVGTQIIVKIPIKIGME